MAEIRHLFRSVPVGKVAGTAANPQKTAICPAFAVCPAVGTHRRARGIYILFFTGTDKESGTNPRVARRSAVPLLSRNNPNRDRMSGRSPNAKIAGLIARPSVLPTGVTLAPLLGRLKRLCGVGRRDHKAIPNPHHTERIPRRSPQAVFRAAGERDVLLNGEHRILHGCRTQMGCAGHRDKAPPHAV